VPTLHSTRPNSDARSAFGSRGIFGPCSRRVERVAVQHAPIAFQFFGTEVLNTSATTSVCSLLSFPVDVEHHVGLFAYQWSPFGTTGAAVEVCVEDTPIRLERQARVEEAIDDENVVEFRSLLRQPERDAAHRNGIRLSTPTAMFVRGRQGRSLRIESNLEEEPE
jgi:hypothetical protein